ncbi:MAG: hypothetical protein LBQ28_01230 [Prevotellaceae bacterium]|jgi:outer membrane protein assembly factor BamA|nr:hypothetical protein [Prevotellaceae bacterium]
MKKIIKKLSIAIFMFGAVNCVFAQTLETSEISETSETSQTNLYLGVGIGFDFGGLGGKIEYLPAKNFGLFAGLGYNMSSLGWNVGATYKISPEKKISPNLMLFYGYNAVFTGDDSYARQYDMTSYGFTLGFNLDIKSGQKGDKWSFGIFIPIRSSKFNDNYDAAKKDPMLDIEGALLPIGISAGYIFKL